jgi:hypothetical protein
LWCNLVGSVGIVVTTPPMQDRLGSARLSSFRAVHGTDSLP